MSPSVFDTLLGLVQDSIRKCDTKFRNAIPPNERLAITLRFLGSGDSLQSISYGFRIGRSTATNIVAETCAAIWNNLVGRYLHFPSTSQEWQEVAEGFETRWNLPHCVGALDGKHVVIECPPNSGSEYYNYKHTFSKVLMGVCDAYYRFLVVDIGNSGANSDGGIFARSVFGNGLENGHFNLPAPSDVPGLGQLPYYFVADEAFPLKPYLMRPFPRQRLSTCEHKVFNYRLGRARGVIENTFGIMASRWRILRRPFKASSSNVDNYIKAIVCLHNFLMHHSSSTYCPHSYVDTEDGHGSVVEGAWRREEGYSMQDISQAGPHMHPRSAAAVRESLAGYLTTVATVPWQAKVIREGRWL
ncbi:uncharacterized protein LOC135392513 [Ornithodoros turicata]|uniref:uncharacterized protein LOC135392513 n=1 Tax=Ornithodoros turicata TaxID=34597 RepID=UPI00313A19BE